MIIVHNLSSSTPEHSAANISNSVVDFADLYFYSIYNKATRVSKWTVNTANLEITTSVPFTTYPLFTENYVKL